MNKPNKKMAMIAGCSALGLACIVGGAYSFFSESKDVSDNSLTVGTVDLKDVDITMSGSVNDVSNVQTDSTFADGVGLTNLNPGDIIPVDFTVENNGNKSIEEKTYVYIIFDNNENNEGYGKYSNFIDSVSILDSSKNPLASNLITHGTYKLNGVNYPAIRFEAGAEDSSYKGVLNGTGNNAETEKDAANATKKEYHYFIKFALDANVHTQNQSLTIKTLTQAVQYRNSVPTVGDTLGTLDTLMNQAEQGIFTVAID